MAVDVTSPSQRALAMWANLIIEIAPAVPDVSNHEVQDAFAELLNTLGEKYVKTYMLDVYQSYWRDEISDGDARYLRAIVQLHRAASQIATARNALTKQLHRANKRAVSLADIEREYNDNLGDNE